MVMPAGLGFSLEFEDAKKKLDALNKEYADLLAEYDELTGSVYAGACLLKLKPLLHFLNSKMEEMTFCGTVSNSTNRYLLSYL